MSVAGISSSLFNYTPQSVQNNFQQFQKEFQQLGQDLQSGNLTQAQQDYATLSQNLPNTGSAAASPVLQALAQLGQDLNAGNLQAARQDYATAQQQASQVTGHHGRHHHHFENSQSSSSSSSSSNSINQAFATLAQDLQAGNLSGAQSAFATLQNDLQHIGGYAPIALNGTGGVSGASSSAAASNLNVSA